MKMRRCDNTHGFKPALPLQFEYIQIINGSKHQKRNRNEKHILYKTPYNRSCLIILLVAYFFGGVRFDQNAGFKQIVNRGSSCLIGLGSESHFYAAAILWSIENLGPDKPTGALVSEILETNLQGTIGAYVTVRAKPPGESGKPRNFICLLKNVDQLQ